LQQDNILPSNPTNCMMHNHLFEMPIASQLVIKSFIMLEPAYSLLRPLSCWTSFRSILMLYISQLLNVCYLPCPSHPPCYCKGTGKYLCAQHESIYGSGGIGPLILNLGSRWRWLVSSMPWPRYPHQYPWNWRLGGSQSWSGWFIEEKSQLLLAGIEPRFLSPVCNPITILSPFYGQSNTWWTLQIMKSSSLVTVPIVCQYFLIQTPPLLLRI